MDILEYKMFLNNYIFFYFLKYAIAYIIIMQLHIIHQRLRIMIVFHMVSEVIQNNLIVSSGSMVLIYPYYFNEGVNEVKAVD